MTYLSLPAWLQERPLYLAELLLALGWSIADTTWTCQGVELAPGTEPTTLEDISDTGRSLNTLELFDASTPDVQLIDGEIFGNRTNHNEVTPVITLRSVDSTSWDLELSEQRCVDSIKSAFPQVTDLSPKLFRE